MWIWRRSRREPKHDTIDIHHTIHRDYLPKSKMKEIFITKQNHAQRTPIHPISPTRSNGTRFADMKKIVIIEKLKVQETADIHSASKQQRQASNGRREREREKKILIFVA